MDLWLVAAATGAGYLAKYWQQLQSKEDRFELESGSSNSINRQLVSSNSAQHIWNQKNSVDRPSNSNIDIGKEFPLGRQDSTEPGDASTGGLIGNNHDCNNVLSLTSLLPGLQGKEILQDGSSREIHISTTRKNLKYRSRRYLARPVDSLESCLLAQFCQKHAKMDDYIYNSIQSPSTSAVRAFLVTDGNRILSRASRDFRGETRLEEDEMHIGAARRIPDIGSSELLRRPRSSVQRVRSRRASNYSSRISFQSQESTNAMHLLLLGMTIGIISTAITYKREMGELKELLKQSQNLAHDLHEELEMKEAISNKENVSFSEEQKSEEKLYDQKLEKYESMSTIEAELEAELERLGLNSKTSSQENLFGMDFDNASDVMYGEARSGSDRKSGTSGDQTHDAYYAVSPWELSVRLHEVVQSRQEARIAELERELTASQKQVHFLESEYTKFERNEYRETESSPQGSPFLTEEDENNVDQPLLLNLSGEALAAYNEAYDELWDIPANDEEKLSTAIHNDNILNVVQEGDQMLFQGQSSRQDGTISQLDVSEERWFRNTVPDKNTFFEVWTSKGWRSNDEEDNDDDEIGQLLIKQIVAKAKEGSSAVLDVQRMLNSMKEQQ